MKTRNNPDKVLSMNIGAGCTQVLVSIMGGYGEAMEAMALEPEAVRDFFGAFVDNLIERYDIFKEYYPDINVVGYNDDWGNERSTFFSAAYFESMVYEPTKKLIDHIKASGDVCFELHSCGKIESFVPYMIDIGADILQIQRRANDIPVLKEKYGDKIGFCCHIEGIEEKAVVSKEERLEKLRRTIDIYGRWGGLYLLFGSPPDSETLWDMCYEAYCYSKEKYDDEREVKAKK
jgi:uroporphyrinogen-III decarboxylase